MGGARHQFARRLLGRERRLKPPPPLPTAGFAGSPSPSAPSLHWAPPFYLLSKFHLPLLQAPPLASLRSISRVTPRTKLSCLQERLGLFHRHPYSAWGLPAAVKEHCKNSESPCSSVDAGGAAGSMALCRVGRCAGVDAGGLCPHAACQARSGRWRKSSQLGGGGSPVSMQSLPSPVSLAVGGGYSQHGAIAESSQLGGGWRVQSACRACRV